MFMIVETPHITQATVIAIIVVSLLTLIGFFASRTPANQEGGPLHFGNTGGMTSRVTGETSNGTTTVPASEHATGVVARTSPAADSEETDARRSPEVLPPEDSERNEYPVYLLA